MTLSRETFTPENVMMREAKDGTVPAKYQELILKDVMQNSKIMQLSQYVEMDDLAKTFQVFLDGPGAYWVDEGNRIQTSAPSYKNITIQAHKLAVILPVSNEYLKYQAGDFFSQMQPRIAEAFYKKFDEAAILNIDNPFKFSLAQSSTAAKDDIQGDITYQNILALEDKITDNDNEPNAFISKAQNNTALRNATLVQNGVVQSLYDRQNGEIDGLATVNLKSTNMKKGELFAGDFDYAYYGIPGTIEYSISSDAQLSTIKAADGQPVNLFEQDMSALRATMTVGFMIVKDGAFSHLTPSAAVASTSSTSSSTGK